MTTKPTKRESSSRRRWRETREAQALRVHKRTAPATTARRRPAASCQTELARAREAVARLLAGQPGQFVATGLWRAVIAPCTLPAVVEHLRARRQDVRFLVIGGIAGYRDLWILATADPCRGAPECFLDHGISAEAAARELTELLRASGQLDDQAAGADQVEAA